MQFDEICRENYARIYNYILAKTGNREAAEDMTQDVFLIAFQKGGAFLCHEKPVAFLYATARNLVLEYYKRDRSKETELDEAKMTAVCHGSCSAPNCCHSPKVPTCNATLFIAYRRAHVYNE